MHFPHIVKFVGLRTVHGYRVDGFSKFEICFAIDDELHFFGEILSVFECIHPFSLIPDVCADDWLAIGHHLEILGAFQQFLRKVLYLVAILQETIWLAFRIGPLHDERVVVVSLPDILHHRLHVYKGGLFDFCWVNLIEVHGGLDCRVQVVDEVGKLAVLGLCFQKRAYFSVDILHLLLIIDSSTS